jgi:Spy/CpxP family protein refolding chaperone
LSNHKFDEERVMLRSIGISGLVLLASLGVAAAQQKANDPGQQAPANPLGDGAFKSQQGGKEEPGSHPAAPATNTDVFVNGKLAVPGAPADGQTVPSKVSERNARLDAIPTMALPLPLTDEQKQKIRASVQSLPVAQISAKPADLLPVTTEVSELSADLKAAIPIMSDIGIIRTGDKILLVRSPNMVVTGEIPAQ